jgi:hypothetical protein
MNSVAAELESIWAVSFDQLVKVQKSVTLQLFEGAKVMLI